MDRYEKEKTVKRQNARSSNADKMRRIWCAGIVRKSGRMRQRKETVELPCRNSAKYFSGRWILYEGVGGIKNCLSISVRKIKKNFYGISNIE